MAEERDIRARLEVERTGDQEAFADAAEELSDLEAALGRAVKAVEGLATAHEDLEAAAAAGNTTTEESEALAERHRQAVEGATRAVEEYRTAVVTAQNTGGVVTRAEIQNVEDLDQSLRRLSQTRRQSAVDLEPMAEATRRQKTLLEELDQALFGNLSGWQKWTVGVGLAIPVFLTAYDAGLKLRDGLNELTDGAFDRFVTGYFKLQENADRLAGLFDRGEQDAQRYQNALNVLAKNGIDVAGLSAEDADRLIDQLGRTMQRQRTETVANQLAQEDWAAKLGLSKKALDEQAAALAANAEAFAASNRQLADTDLAAIFGPRIQALLDLYRRLGIEAPPEIRKLADAWSILDSAAEASVERAKRYAEEYRAAITGKAVVSLDELEARLRGLRDTVGDLDLLPLPGDEQFDRAKAQVAELVESYRAAGVAIPAVLVDIADSFQVLVAPAERSKAVVVGMAATMGSGMVTVRDKVDELGRKVGVELVQHFSAAEAEGRLLAGLDLSQASDEVRELLGRSKELGPSIRSSGEDASAAASLFGAAAAEVEAGAEAFSGQAAAAADAGREIEGAAAASEGLASAQGRVRTEVSSTETQLTTLETRIAGLGPKTDVAAGQMVAALAKVPGAFDPILAKVSEVEAAIGRTLAQVQALRDLTPGPSGGGAPVEVPS